MTNFLSAHGVRLYGVLAALLPLLLLRWPDLPSAALLAFAAVLLGVGEAAQRVENTKTLSALYSDSPFEAELRGNRAE
ncbi:hypothetical protein ABCR94_38950 [Streptomyces sp. 21So2-11]|uniref:hypothetical protein n=1 Tax=Streptomyces sp. 21So2-11 TaxID=3144408 RepID=UPI00321B1F89